VNSAASDTVHLARYQAEMVDGVLGAQHGSIHYVVWPPGAGKTFATAVLLDRLSQGKDDFRALIVAPRFLTDQWAHVVKRATADSIGETVDHARLRDFVAHSSGQGMWPRRGCFAISAALLAIPDVRSLIETCYWDVVVLDEAHHRQRVVQSVLSDLIRTQRVGRALILSASHLDQTWSALGSAVATFTWKADVLAVSREMQLGQREFRSVQYLPNPEVGDAVGHLLTALRRSLPSRAGSLLVDGLYRRAASSPLALVSSLERLRSQWLHGDARSPFEYTEGEDEIAEMRAPALGRQTHALVLEVVNVVGILGAADDPKLEALVTLIRGLLRESRRSCVFTTFRETAEYVRNSLEDEGLDVMLCHGGLAYDTRLDLITRFNRRKAVLVTTDGGASGLQVSDSAVAVSYDLPRSVKPMDGRWAVIEARGDNRRHTMIALVGGGDASAVEGELANFHGFAV